MDVQPAVGMLVQRPPPRAAAQGKPRPLSSSSVDAALHHDGLFQADGFPNPFPQVLMMTIKNS